MNILIVLLVLLLWGCAGMSASEIEECQIDIAYIGRHKLQEIETMNTTPPDSLDHRFAMVNYRLWHLDMKPYFEKSKAACWEMP